MMEERLDCPLQLRLDRGVYCRLTERPSIQLCPIEYGGTVCYDAGEEDKQIDKVLSQAWSNGVHDYADRSTEQERQALLLMSGPNDGAGIPELRARILTVMEEGK